MAGDRREAGRGGLQMMTAVMMLAVMAAACAGMNFESVRPGLDRRGHYIAGVPFYKQPESSCGPAALAGVAAFWGRKENIEAIRGRVYSPELRGTLPMDMERYLREAGFETLSSSGSLDELKAFVRDDIPVICLIDLGFSVYRRPHYVIVIGYDEANGLVICHDGVMPNRVMSTEQFLKDWSRAGQWMLVARPLVPVQKEEL